MYNSGMKNIVENNVKDILKKYKYCLLLIFIIIILFSIVSYSKNENYKVYINEKQVKLEYGIYVLNNEQYIHIDDLKKIFNNNIYNDKIAGKIIITTYDKLIKIEKSDSNYIIKDNNNEYVKLEKITQLIGNSIVISNDRIYILTSDIIEGTIIENRTELYDTINNQIICFLEKNDKVKIHIDKNTIDVNNQKLNVEVEVEGITYFGYVLKQNVQYEYKNENENKNNDQQSMDEKVVIVKSDDKLVSSTDTKYVDYVAINMYRLSGVNTLTKLDYANNVGQMVDILATVNNGQKSSKYDNDIVTGMLNSQSNREKITQQILKGVKNLAGVNLDFSNFKLSDRDNYTQFVKELAALMHMNNKIITINISGTQYVDVEKISEVVDYIIIQPYFERSLSSKTSGPISSIKYVEKCVQDIIQKGVDVEKVVLEIPVYTILWTERYGTVINAELYSMKTMKEYITENNIESKLDNISGQNYINYSKGITTYKMWLEDEQSIKYKTEFVNKYNLAGVSIYKSGLEVKSIYAHISKLLNK